MVNYGIRVLIVGDIREELVRQLAVNSLNSRGFDVLEISGAGTSSDDWKASFKQFQEKKEGDCLLTIGGAGYGEGNDIPHMTSSIITRNVPGLPEAIRDIGSGLSSFSPLFRGAAGLTAEGRLIINLPDEEEWLVSSMEYVGSVLKHALDKATGDPTECAR